MTLALFDLDNTLLRGDSDHLWGQFLCREGLVDSEQFSQANDAFYADYVAGTLDIDAYLRHALGPIAGRTPADVRTLQNTFVQQWITPILLPAALDLLDDHRRRGHTLVIITATNTVVTRPIADRLGVPHLIGCEAELHEGRYTGAPSGTPSFQEGKVTRLREWLSSTEHSLAGAWFYSDSHNDLPLLEAIDNPVAVDPDDRLKAIAKTRGWPVLSLR